MGALGQRSWQRFRRRSLGKSEFANDYKVSEFGRELAISKTAEKMATDVRVRSRLWILSGARLICHCTSKQACHTDAIIDSFHILFPDAYDRENTAGEPPTSEVLNYLALLRQEPESDPGSSADEGVPCPGAGWIGTGEPMMVGAGYTSRPLCDGQSLASPGRWPPHARRCLSSEHWKDAARHFLDFAKKHGSAELLMKLALSKVESPPFEPEAVAELKHRVVSGLSAQGYDMRSTAHDRTDLPIDYRFLELLLETSGDPEVGMEQFARGVRVGPGVRLPHARKKRWRLPEQLFSNSVSPLLLWILSS